ncbi:MAG: thioredoxin family protein [Bacteroidota bacterium]
MKSIISAKLFVLLCSIIVSTNIMAQQMNQKDVDTKTQQEILSGNCNRSGLLNGEFSVFYQKEYADYALDSSTIERLKNYSDKFNVSIVMATWCDDSREQVPRFLKILDEMHFSENKLSLICVNRDKKSKFTNIDTLKVEKVPTFIIYKNNVEAGRIIETPKQTLEKDLFEILKK